MSNEKWQRVWRFLNSPLIVVIIGVLLWAVLQTAMTEYQLRTKMDSVLNRYTNLYSSITGRFGSNTNLYKNPMADYDKKADQEALEVAAVSANLRVTNVYPVAGRKGMEKYLASFVNDSDKTLREIWLAVSYFDQQDRLIDVDERGGRVALVKPGETNMLGFERQLGDYAAGEAAWASNRSTRIEVTVRGFKIVKAGEPQGSDSK